VRDDPRVNAFVRRLTSVLVDIARQPGPADQSAHERGGERLDTHGADAGVPCVRRRPKPPANSKQHRAPAEEGLHGRPPDDREAE
jgi:hypothetical protein